jgi:hypothetical protein
MPDLPEDRLSDKEYPDSDMQVRPFETNKKGCATVILLVVVIIAAILMAVR